jgi:hypothetical protein
MTRGFLHALCRLLALLACAMCSQQTSRAYAETLEQPIGGIAAEAGPSAAWVSAPGFSSEHETDGNPGAEPSREERESDDDDQDDDFDDAQPLHLRGTLWGTAPLVLAFGAALAHDPDCSNHRLLDPRPPRRA